MIAVYIAGFFGGLSLITAAIALYLLDLDTEYSDDPKVCADKSYSFMKDACE